MGGLPTRKQREGGEGQREGHRYENHDHCDSSRGSTFWLTSEFIIFRTHSFISEKSPRSQQRFSSFAVRVRNCSNNGCLSIGFEVLDLLLNLISGVSVKSENNSRNQYQTASHLERCKIIYFYLVVSCLSDVSRQKGRTTKNSGLDVPKLLASWERGF